MAKLNAPTMIGILLTERCNLRCVFCGIKPFKTKDELSTERWINLFYELKGLKVFYIVLSGGEIFLKKDIFDLLTTACNLFPNGIRINTNGTLLSKLDIKKLSELKYRDIGTSIDGMQFTHDKIRGKGSYEKTINFIKELIHNKMRFDVCFTPTRINYHEFSDVVDYLSELGVKSFKYSQLVPEDSCPLLYDELKLRYPDEQLEFTEMINSINKKYSYLRLSNEYSCYLKMEENFNTLSKQNLVDKMKAMPIWQCSAGKSSCVILPNGDLIPCCAFYSLRGRNIKNNSFYEAWHKSDWFDLQQLEGCTTDNIIECSKCKFKILCGSGCRGYNYEITHNILSPDIDCPFIGNQIVSNQKSL